MRKHYLDNLRSMCTWMLFPYHTFMIFNCFGEGFYIKGDCVVVFDGFILATYPWLMPLLFVIAGISTRYALNTRSVKQYVCERFARLFVPLIFGIGVLIPLQTYYAEVFHNGYSGGYFEQYIMFFTKWTDLTGYEGGFTPAHLWFLIYLFLISMLALPLIRLHKKSKIKLPIDKMTIPVILPLFVVYMLLLPIFSIGGKSIVAYLSLFLMGYFVLSEQSIQSKLEQHRWKLLALFLPMIVIHLLLINVHHFEGVVYGITVSIAGWFGVLAILGWGSRYLNHINKLTAYCAKVSFSVYVLHQSVLVAAAYYVFSWTDNAILQACLILLLSFAGTLACCEVTRRIPGLRFMLGIKHSTIQIKAADAKNI